MEVHKLAVDRRGIELEITCMYDPAEGGIYAEPDTVHNAVCDPHKLDIENSELNDISWPYRYQPDFFEAVRNQLVPDQAEGQGSAVTEILFSASFEISSFKRNGSAPVWSSCPWL